MDAEHTKPLYKIWAVDDVVYGPVDLATIAEWVKDERVLSDTWIYDLQEDSWHKAVQIKAFQPCFQSKTEFISRGEAPVATPTPLIPGLKPGMLRRVKILADLTDQQLGRFAQYMEVIEVRQWTEIVKQGIPGDTMYLVLAGEVRVRLMINKMETTIVTLSAGEFFGEIALFDHGPRSADVIANSSSVLLKISTAAIGNLVEQAPDVAAPFMRAICKTLTSRIRAGNKRMRDSIALARAANASW